MKTAIVIPARYASSRLPGKPLLKETGKYLIQHVYERASQARHAGTVLVATDDPRIVAAVQGFDGRVVTTRRDHASGTDRVAEAASALDCEVIVNVQGDEPLIDPAAIDLVADLVHRQPGVDMATLAVPFQSEEQWRNPNCVKVVCDANGRALYFSRSPIPHVRDGKPDFAARPARYLLHLGLYAYRRRFLLQLANQDPAPLEQLEKLEQLRVLTHGRHLQVGIVEQASLGVDTYEDYERFVAIYRQNPSLQAA